MGTILTGYGDAAYDHEGYAGQVLEDGSLTSTYSDQTAPRMIGQVVACCGCGWTGTTRYPTTDPFHEAAEELALGEWERTHARPVLEGRRADDWNRLRLVLRELAASSRAATTGAQFITLPSADQLEVLDATLRALRRATELAGQLREPLTTGGGEQQ